MVVATILWFVVFGGFAVELLELFSGGEAFDGFG